MQLGNQDICHAAQMSSSLGTLSTDNSIQSFCIHDLRAKMSFCPSNKHGRDCVKDVRQYHLHLQVLQEHTSKPNPSYVFC